MNDTEWNDEKQGRLDALRAREDAGTLTPAEQAELDQLLAILDELEWQQFRPALERMKREHVAAVAAIERLEHTRRDLTELIARQRQLIIRARGQLRELLAEHRVLQADYRRLNIEVPTGQWFHIRRLRLNRPQLVSLRQARRRAIQDTARIAELELILDETRREVAPLESQLESLLEQISQLTGQSE